MQPDVPLIVPEEWQHRFKIVKIPTKKPETRAIGRWLCMDYRDTNRHTMIAHNLTANQGHQSLQGLHSHISHNHHHQHHESHQQLPLCQQQQHYNQTNEIIPKSVSNEQNCQKMSDTSIDAESSTLTSTINLLDNDEFKNLVDTVREEVAVLQQTITDLLFKISRLEYENGLLKSHMPDEVLCHLKQQLGARYSSTDLAAN